MMPCQLTHTIGHIQCLSVLSLRLIFPFTPWHFIPIHLLVGITSESEQMYKPLREINDNEPLWGNEKYMDGVGVLKPI